MAEVISQWFAPDAILLQQDCYYRDHPALSAEQRSRLNYDHPTAFDHALLLEHLQRLSGGHEIERPQYDFAIHRRLEQRRAMSPKPVIVVEGLFAWWEDAVRAQLDLRIFVDADPDLRFIRRLRRDMEERGRTIESVVHQYLETVRPMHEAWIEPAREQAHAVLRNSGAWEETEAVLKRKLAELLPASLAGRLMTAT